MSKILRRITALVLALAVVLTLAACGGGSQGGGTSIGGTGNAASVEDAFDSDAFIATVPDELKGTTLTYLSWYDPYQYAQEGKVIDAFEQASGINVDVIVANYGTEYNDKLAGLVATGDAPDVYQLDYPRTAYMKSAQPIVAATGYDFSDPAWSNAVKEAYSVGGVQYAANLAYTPFKRMLTVVYNKQMMEEFGFEDPWQLYKDGKWTWQKMEEMCTEWVKQGPDYYGVATVSYDMVAATQGVDFMKYDGSQWQLNLYDTDVLEAWKYTLEQKTERIFVQSNDTTFDVAKPKSLFLINNTAGLEKNSTWNNRIKKYGYFAAAPMPSFEGKEYYAPVSELNAFAVAIGAKNPKAVPYFISYFCNLAKYNIDEYYYDEQSKEVMLELLGTEKQYQPMSLVIFNFETNPFSWHLFNNGTAAQITTFIQSMEYQCKDKLNQLNDVLANMHK